MFARNVVPGYFAGLCVILYHSCVVLVLLCFFRMNTSPPRVAVSVATFHPGYLSFLRLTPRLADGPQEVFRMTSPFY